MAIQSGLVLSAEDDVARKDTVGMPKMRPEGVRWRPFGSGPEVTFHRYGAVPPRTSSEVSYQRPTRADGSDVAGVVIAKPPSSSAPVSVE